MLTTILYLSFRLSNDKIRTFSVDRPVEGLEANAVGAVMDYMIENNIFEIPLVSKVSARYVTRTVDELEIAEVG